MGRPARARRPRSRHISPKIDKRQEGARWSERAWHEERKQNAGQVAARALGADRPARPDAGADVRPGRARDGGEGQRAKAPVDPALGGVGRRRGCLDRGRAGREGLGHQREAQGRERHRANPARGLARRRPRRAGNAAETPLRRDWPTHRAESATRAPRHSNRRWKRRRRPRPSPSVADEETSPLLPLLTRPASQRVG